MEGGLLLLLQMVFSFFCRQLLDSERWDCTWRCLDTYCGRGSSPSSGDNCWTERERLAVALSRWCWEGGGGGMREVLGGGGEGFEGREVCICFEFCCGGGFTSVSRFEMDGKVRGRGRGGGGGWRSVSSFEMEVGGGGRWGGGRGWRFGVVFHLLAENDRGV